MLRVAVAPTLALAVAASALTGCPRSATKYGAPPPEPPPEPSGAVVDPIPQPVPVPEPTADPIPDPPPVDADGGRVAKPLYGLPAPPPPSPPKE